MGRKIGQIHTLGTRLKELAQTLHFAFGTADPIQTLSVQAFSNEIRPHTNTDHVSRELEAENFFGRIQICAMIAQLIYIKPQIEK